MASAVVEASEPLWPLGSSWPAVAVAEKSGRRSHETRFGGYHSTPPANARLARALSANNTANQAKSQQTQTTHQAWHHYFW